MGTPLTKGGLDVRFALLEYRADWMWINQSLGFPAHNQAQFCWKCHCTKASAFRFESSWDWPLRTHESYVGDAARVQFQVTVDRPSLLGIFALLSLDWRLQGMHGMMLTKDIVVRDIVSGSDVLLQLYDRLEGYGSDYDVHCSPKTLPNPCKLVFFRRREDVFLNFVPLLFSIPFFRFEYLIHDVLHALDQGVIAKLAGDTIQRLLQHKILCTVVSKPGYLRGLQKLNAELRQYVSIRRKEYQLRRKGRFSTFSRITLGMLGLKKSLKKGAMLQGKGIEIRHLLPFCIKILQKHVSKVPGGRNLPVAMQDLQKAYSIMDGQGIELTEQAQGDFDHLVKSVAINSRKADVKLRPKFHMLPHMGSQCYTAGNLRFASSIEDESHNCDVVRIIATSHAKDVVVRLLCKQSLLTRLENEEMSLLGNL